MVREIMDIWGYAGFYEDETISEKSVLKKIIKTSEAYIRNISDIYIINISNNAMQWFS